MRTLVLVKVYMYMSYLIWVHTCWVGVKPPPSCRKLICHGRTSHSIVMCGQCASVLIHSTSLTQRFLSSSSTRTASPPHTTDAVMTSKCHLFPLTSSTPSIFCSLGTSTRRTRRHSLAPLNAVLLWVNVTHKHTPTWLVTWLFDCTFQTSHFFTLLSCSFLHHRLGSWWRRHRMVIKRTKLVCRG